MDMSPLSDAGAAPWSGAVTLAAPEPPRRRLLLVDAEWPSRAALAETLAGYGFEVKEAGSLRAAEAALAEGWADLMVLEPLLPGEDGLDGCRRLLSRGEAAVILLSTSRDPIDRIVGLELGADDYLGKPAETRELVARIRAVLRRSRPVGSAGSAPGDPVFSGWRLSLARHEVTAPDGGRVTLSRTEFGLMTAFLAHPQTPIDRRRLGELACGKAPERGTLRGVDTQVSRLRQRLEACSRGGAGLIRTVNGRGYMLDAPVRAL